MDDAEQALRDAIIADLEAAGWTLHDTTDATSPEMAGRRVLIAPGRVEMHGSTFYVDSELYVIVADAEHWANEAAPLVRAVLGTADGRDIVTVPTAVYDAAAAKLRVEWCVGRYDMLSGQGGPSTTSLV